MKIRWNETKDRAFALPTILIASVVMLMILTTAVSATVAIRQSLRDQQYTELAQLAGQAGTAYAKACMQANGGIITWTDAKPLKPNTDCSGNISAGLPTYVLQRNDVRTYFVVKAPVAGNISGQGYLEALRKSSGISWQVWGGTASAAALGSDMPIGTSLEGYWTAAPSGFLLEDGSAVSRTTYAELFAVIGTTFGTGNGSTTFNLPDSRGRVTVNKSTDTEFDTLGEKYGEKAHTLTQGESPYQRSGGLVAGYGLSNTAAFQDRVAVDRLSGSATSPHNVIQPSIVVLRVIKY